MPDTFHHDLKLFSISSSEFDSSGSTFNCASVEQVIEQSSHRAIMISNAATQILLAGLEEEGSSHQVDRFEQAEQIAYDLGYLEFTLSPFVKSAAQIDKINPFPSANLQQAWDNGFTRSAIDNKNQEQEALKKKLWNSTINVECDSTQYSQAALALFNIAEQTSDPKLHSRASDLANEMLSYDDERSPTLERQKEIDQFLLQQALRLANELDL